MKIADNETADYEVHVTSLYYFYDIKVVFVMDQNLSAQLSKVVCPHWASQASNCVNLSQPIFPL